MKKFVTICVLCATVLACSCSQEKKPKPTPPVPVTAAPVVRRSIPVQIEAIGTVVAFQSISLKSRVTGAISRVHFTEGQDVKKGDLLIELDRSTAMAELKESEANLLKDRAQAIYAREQEKRYADLLKKDYVSREQYEQAKASAESLKATIEADEAVVENNRIQLRYCLIHAPISGRIGRLKIDVGNIVSANTTEIAVINQIEPVSVSFSIPEKDLSSVKSYFGQRRLELDAVIPGLSAPEKGELTFMDNAVDPSTGTITLKGTFANTSRHLWPGQYVDVVLTLATEPDAILAPSKSIEQGPEGAYVYVLKPDDTVEVRPVATGRIHESWTVIVKGVAEGDQVITDGQLRLSPGAKVAIRGKK